MKLYIRDFETRSIVREFDVSGRSQGMIERIMLGILHNLNTDKYFVDDSETDVEVV